MSANRSTNGYHGIAVLDERSTRGTPFVIERIGCHDMDHEIVGESPKLQRVLEQVESVASTDSTVLILGETGTGKELVAWRIHNHSQRRQQAFVKVNCAAIPLDLLESELFGHERGAFTGAVAQRIGRFEVADQGTLFMDEIGDIPLQLQPKLLRVLQEQEFERLGSTRTIRTNVRLIAATHRNLGQNVKEGKFRADLFYRFNVFPITTPPLRERPDDIPRLIRHFTRKYAERMHKRIEIVPCEAMEILMNYSWPGNIRELQNFIERAVILSCGPALSMPLDELIRLKHEGTAEPITLKDAERAHILRTLQKTNGQLTGAAALLGVPRSTLFYRIRRLGISVPRTGKAQKRKPHTDADGNSLHIDGPLPMVDGNYRIERLSPARARFVKSQG
jgi:formate hydrogenlyase transcriptional activator